MPCFVLYLSFDPAKSWEKSERRPFTHPTAPATLCETNLIRTPKQESLIQKIPPAPLDKLIMPWHMAFCSFESERSLYYNSKCSDAIGISLANVFEGADDEFIGLWLPQYANTLKYSVLILPVCIYECKYSLIINTYLKNFGKEKIIGGINALTVLIAAATTTAGIL